MKKIRNSTCSIAGHVVCSTEVGSWDYACSCFVCDVYIDCRVHELYTSECESSCGAVHTGCEVVLSNKVVGPMGVC